MKKKIGNYIMRKNIARLTEINFHDFVHMVQAGLCDEEIAEELGVHKSYIEKLKNEMQKDF
ncbi:helix-turn-helix domain-containing protein [Crassaminicella thermophila]|uniref:Helix-turn-helix domain-containing protein n=1 Tax=Crassaminicella thermophila TaxID=2599308 RepID=A0A5C0SBT5_CRATE|nr:helix-turn-helix domain-containing protein [Crassaminicella thermophila]QEK12075.1 helix-turn-helix domain-containing protein [Crassaminicella thermophila]